MSNGDMVNYCGSDCFILGVDIETCSGLSGGSVTATGIRVDLSRNRVPCPIPP
jgi:hypothetical protein